MQGKETEKREWRREAGKRVDVSQMEFGSDVMRAMSAMSSMSMCVCATSSIYDVCAYKYKTTVQLGLRDKIKKRMLKYFLVQFCVCSSVFQKD